MSAVSLWLEPPASARRTGLKGPRAAALLAELGINVPGAPNSWAPLRAADRDDSANVVARLGSTEFLVVDGDGETAAMLEARLVSGVPGAYAALREDFALELGGGDAPAALAEVCNVDFAAVPPGKPVYLTLMLGIGVLVLPQQREDGRVFRIWCDPTYGAYLQEEIEGVVNRIQSGRAS